MQARNIQSWLEIYSLAIYSLKLHRLEIYRLEIYRLEIYRFARYGLQNTDSNDTGFQIQARNTGSLATQAWAWISAYLEMVKVSDSTTAGGSKL